MEHFLYVDHATFLLTKLLLVVVLWEWMEEFFSFFELNLDTSSNKIHACIDVVLHTHAHTERSYNPLFDIYF